MRRTQSGTERNHIKSWTIGTNNTAFQTCMNNLHGRFHTKLLLIGQLHGMQYRRIHIGLPSGITTTQFHLHTCHSETSCQAVCQEILHRIARTTRQNTNFGLTVCNDYDSQIGGSFYSIGNSRNHTHHTILASHQHVNHIILNF